MGSSSSTGLAGDRQPRRATEPDVLLDEAGEGPRAQVLRGAAEGTGVVQPGEKEAEGRPHRSLQLPERRL